MSVFGGFVILEIFTDKIFLNKGEEQRKKFYLMF